MAVLNINLRAFSYQRGIKVLANSFESATTALGTDVASAVDEAIAYQQQVEQTGEWEGERDEDGSVIWDQADILNFEIESAEEAAMALRKAYVIALYHHWERSVRTWTNKPHGKHEALAEGAAALGYPIHPKLTAVRDLSNTLKHDADKWGHALIESWRGVFLPDWAPRVGVKTDWYESVHLTDRHIEEVIEIVAASGPG